MFTKPRPYPQEFREDGIKPGMTGAQNEELKMAKRRIRLLEQENVLDRQRWATHAELRIAVVTWIERSHHRRRRPAALGRLAPIEFDAIIKPAAEQAE